MTRRAVRATPIVALFFLFTFALATASAAQATPPPPGSDWTQESIKSSGGVTLHADVLRPKGMPKDAAHKTPVILSIGPYFNHSGQTGPAGPVEDTPYDPLTANGPSDRFYDFIEGSGLLQKGYTWVQVDLRGFGGSNGCLDWGGPGEQSDVKAAVEWAASQSWSTGKVGMYGKSYDAVTGLIGIKQQPKGLAAVISQEPVYDLYRYLYMNRTRYENSLATPALYDAIAGTPGPLLGSGETNSGDILAYNFNSFNDTARPGCPALNYSDQQDPNHSSAYWKERNIIAGLKGKKTPLFMTQGLLENNTKPDGAVDAFNSVKGPKRAWFGMWDHVRGNEVDPDENGRLKMGRHGWFDETMRFYDHYLKGVKPTVTDPKIAVETNDGRWRAESAWPPKDAFGATAQLKPGAYSDDGTNNGSGDGGSPPYGEGIWTFSPTFGHEVRLSGTPSVNIDTDGTEGTNLYVDLYDVGPTGKAILFSRGAYLLTSSGKAKFDLYDQDWVFRPDHRLGALVTGGQSDWWVQPPTGRTVNVKSASLSLPYLSCQRPAHIEGLPSLRLVDYLDTAPIDVDAQTINENTVAGFPIPGALGNCSKAKKKACIDRRKFRFTIDQPRKGRIVRVTAYVNGKRRVVKRGKRVTTLTLRRLPKGTFKVKIVALAKNGQRTISVRTYKGCVKSAPHTHVVKPHK
jgi:putative CocE/NonD family hydrolase